MSEIDYSHLSHDELIEMCSRTLYSLDGLWFTAVEKKFGTDAAIELDRDVWRELGRIEARRILKTLKVKVNNPIHTLAGMFKFDPLLRVYRPEVNMLDGHKAVLRCTDCPSQKARIRDGRGEFPCKEVGIALFDAYASVVDPGMKVTCRVCPPDKHPADFWCEWQFEV